MQTFYFDDKKYGKKLPIDLGEFSSTPHFFFETEPHTVDFYEIFFFRKARGTLQLDAQVIELKDNLLVYASPFQRRRWQVDREEIEGYFLIFSRNFFELLFADKLFAFKLHFFHNYNRPLYMVELPDSQLRHNHAFRNIQYELNHLREDSEDFIRAFLLLILAGHNRRYCDTYGIVPERNENMISYRFKKKLEEIIHENPTVEMLAKHFQVSRITLNKQIKDKFGVSAKDLIKDRMLVEIQRMLLFTTKTIKEIAFELHFTESQHMIRFFKQRTGRTPADFRHSYQNGTP